MKDVITTVNENNATFNVSVTGLNTPSYRLVDYQNFLTGEYIHLNEVQSSNIFNLTGLDNGFYRAGIEIFQGKCTRLVLQFVMHS